MTGLFFGAAIFLAAGAMGARAWRKRRAKSVRAAAQRQAPGMSAESPLRIRSFDELDDFVERARCPCGGLLERIGEGGRAEARVVRCACLVCEEDVDLFFVLSRLEH